jgi:hypothetical protein
MSVKKLKNAGSWEITVTKRNEKDPEKGIETSIEVWDADYNQFAIVIGKDWYWIDKSDFKKCWKEMI